MPAAVVVDQDRTEVGQVELDERLFAVHINPSLLHEAIIMQRASERQGTASTKTRGEVRGGGKKPWRQKGTGRARAGSIRSPIWRGGGTVFGPHPRSYAFRMPRKKYRAALRAALTAKAQEGRCTILKALTLPGPKTGVLVGTLARLGLTGSTLIVTERPDPVLRRASRNLRHVSCTTPERLNVYDLLRVHDLVIVEPALPALVACWGGL